MKKVLKIFIIVLAILCTIVGIFILSGFSQYKSATKDDAIKKAFSDIKSKESYITLEKLPEDFLNAVVSIEDNRYYKHSAIDIKSIFRAIIVNINDREFTEGGSTITQQVAKNTFFTQEKKLTRKVAEVFTAFDIEEAYSKKEILEIYVNINYYGSGYYGIYDACKGYLNKEPKDMTLAECALLAGIPNAPSVYSPNKNKELSIKRQKIVLKSMLENGYITKEDYEDAMKEIDKKSAQTIIIRKNIGEMKDICLYFRDIKEFVKKWSWI